MNSETRRDIRMYEMGILEYVTSVSLASLSLYRLSALSVFRARSQTGNSIDNLSRYADGAFTVYSS